ncbi:MAG TPA: hypothetical protein VGK88_01095 [bacterium]
MKVTILLADAAQAIEGKLYILGGGWSITGPDPVPSAIAVKIEVPWDAANQKHHLTLALFDADGRAVMLPTPSGDTAVELGADFEVGRPPGLKPGTPIDAVFAVNIAPLPLSPDGRYVWRLSIDDRTDEDWQLAFSTRPKK